METLIYGRVCSRCKTPASHKRGNQFLCPKHYRFGQMRVTAKRHGKTVPTHDQLEILATRGMTCQDCSRVMNWLARDGQTTVISLQHYRDGTYGLVCRSCNTRHAFMDGDDYRSMPATSKLCPSCSTVKPLHEFYSDRGRSGEMRKKSYCVTCSNALVAEWRAKNRDDYNQSQRDGRARRKALKSREAA